MTRLITRDGHSAVHGLAMRAGCSCPDCGCGGPRRFEALEADLFDEGGRSLLRRRPAPATSRSGQLPVPGDLREALAAVLRALGWSRWRGGNVTMQDLVAFESAGGVAAHADVPGCMKRGNHRLCVTTAGTAMLAPGGQFHRLSPLFRRFPGQVLYRISGPPNNTPYYVGKTRYEPGIRPLEHLRPGSRIRGRLRAQQPRFGSLRIQYGWLNLADRGRRSHLAEVALAELMRSTWNSPSGHGFEESEDNGW